MRGMPVEERIWTGTERLEYERTQTARDVSPAESAPKPVIFVVTQNGPGANGGVESITQVITRLRDVLPIVVTQSETDFNTRWRDAGADVRVWPMGSLSFAALLRNNLRLFRLVRAERCGVVHCNDIYALWQTGFGARLAKAAVAFNIRNVKSA